MDKQDLQIVKTVIHSMNIKGDVEDYFQDGCIGLINAYSHFKLEKGVKFETFASTCIRAEILGTMRKAKQKGKVPEDQKIYTDDEDVNIQIGELDSYPSDESIDYILSVIPKKHRHIVILLSQGLTVQQVADIEGHSYVNIYRKVKKCKEILIENNLLKCVDIKK